MRQAGVMEPEPDPWKSRNDGAMRDGDRTIERLTAVVLDALGDDLVSLILYGSAVAGGLRPDSDIDLLAVTAQPLRDAQRERLIDGLLAVSGRRALHGPSRPVELTVMALADLGWEHPVVQLQYGEWLRDDAIAGRLEGPHVDADAVLLMAMARERGTALVGRAPTELLPEVPAAAVRSAIVATLPALLDDLDGDERNVVLTLARMLETLRGAPFLPKDVAAERVALTVPDDQARMLTIAAAAYRGEVDDDWTSLASAMHAFVGSAVAGITGHDR